MLKVGGIQKKKKWVRKGKNYSLFLLRSNKNQGTSRNRRSLPPGVRDPEYTQLKQPTARKEKLGGEGLRLKKVLAVTWGERLSRGGRRA